MRQAQRGYAFHSLAYATALVLPTASCRASGVERDADLLVLAAQLGEGAADEGGDACALYSRRVGVLDGATRALATGHSRTPQLRANAVALRRFAGMAISKVSAAWRIMNQNFQRLRKTKYVVFLSLF